MIRKSLPIAILLTTISEMMGCEEKRDASADMLKSSALDHPEYGAAEFADSILWLFREE